MAAPDIVLLLFSPNKQAEAKAFFFIFSIVERGNIHRSSQYETKTKNVTQKY